MPRPATQHPTDRELEILDLLWKQGPMGLGELRDALAADREVAATTVATLLRIMHGKRLVRRRQTKAGYRWSACVTPKDAASGIIGKLVDRIFDGSAGRLAAHLVENGGLSPSELADLRRLIEQRDVKRKVNKKQG